MKLLSGPSLASLSAIIWAKFAFLKTLFVKKHYKKGVSTSFVGIKRLRTQSLNVIILAKLAI